MHETINLCLSEKISFTSFIRCIDVWNIVDIIFYDLFLLAILYLALDLQSHETEYFFFSESVDATS